MNEPVRVLVIIGQLEVGGTERHLLAVLPKINRAPLACTVYALRGGGGLEPAFMEAGIRVIRPPKYSRRWLGLLRTAYHLVATLRSERPRIVHFFLPEAYLLGGFCSLLLPRCVRIMSRRSLNRYQRRWAAVRPIERLLHHQMDGILANSRAVLTELHEEGVGDEVSGVIYNGVRRMSAPAPGADAALRTDLDLAPDAVVLVVVANLIAYKGHADLITALVLARDRLPEAWALLLIGKDSGIKADLERRANAGGIARHIRWLGRQDDVDRYLSVADIALLTSHQEGFSNAILEAMAAGVPLIVTDVGGNSEAVLDGDTGLVVPPNDASALAVAVVQLAADPQRRQEMGRSGRTRAIEHFPIDRCAEAYRRVYLSLARGERSSIGALIRAES